MCAGASWDWGRVGASFVVCFASWKIFSTLTLDTFAHVCISVLHFNHRVVTPKKQLILEFWAYVAHFKESEKNYSSLQNNHLWGKVKPQISLSSSSKEENLQS